MSTTVRSHSWFTELPVHVLQAICLSQAWNTLQSWNLLSLTCYVENSKPFCLLVVKLTSFTSFPSVALLKREMQSYFILFVMLLIVSWNYSLYCKKEDTKLTCHRLLILQPKNSFQAVSKQFCTDQKAILLPSLYWIISHIVISSGVTNVCFVGCQLVWLNTLFCDIF